MATWETPTSQPAQTCRSFRRANVPNQPQPPPPPPPSLYNPGRHHAAASSIPTSNHSSSTARSTARTHREIQRSHELQRHNSIYHRSRRLMISWRAMAAGGVVVLNLRVPSASVAPARRCGTASSSSVRCGSARGAAPARQAGGGLEEDHYRTLRLEPGATRGEVKKAFHRLALQYHPDVVRRRGGDDGQENMVEFERINAAYQTVMSNMRGAEATLEYWRRRYGLADEDLDRYRHYLNDDDEDDWFSDL